MVDSDDLFISNFGEYYKFNSFSMNNQYHCPHNTNLITDQYNSSTSDSHSSSYKYLQRRQDPNLRKQRLSRQKNRKFHDDNESQIPICYISTSKQKEKNVNNVSYVRKLLGSPRRPKIHQNQGCQQSVTNGKSPETQNTFKKQRRMKSRSKTDKLSQALKLEELQLLKISLNREIRVLNQQIESRDKTIQDMQDQINQLKLQINRQCRGCKQKELKITEFGIIIEELQGKIKEKQETILKTKNSGSLETEEDLEKFISDVHRTFEELSITESKIHEDTRNQHRLEMIILNLQQKIKYQQIEITMMKKHKFDQHKIQAECEKYKAQNKFLFSKIRTMHQQKQKKKGYCDNSISFDLSQDGSSIL